MSGLFFAVWGMNLAGENFEVRGQDTPEICRRADKADTSSMVAKAN